MKHLKRVFSFKLCNQKRLYCHTRFVWNLGVDPTSENNCMQERDRIYHPNCYAKCLIICLTDFCPFRWIWFFFLIYTILIALYPLLFVNSIVCKLLKIYRSFVNLLLYKIFAISFIKNFYSFLLVLLFYNNKTNRSQLCLFAFSLCWS